MDKRHSMPVSPSLPPGWIEKTEAGETYFVNEVSTEKVRHAIGCYGLLNLLFIFLFSVSSFSQSTVALFPRGCQV